MDAILIRLQKKWGDNVVQVCGLDHVIDVRLPSELGSASKEVKFP